MASDAPLVLGIETSCDETGIGLVRGHDLLANEIASSVDEHARFGGVVPEVASRAHLEAMEPALHRACAAAGVRLRDVDAIAVTGGQAEFRHRRHAAPQPVRGQHLAARRKAQVIERLDLPPVGGGFLCNGDHPCAAPQRTVSRRGA